MRRCLSVLHQRRRLLALLPPQRRHGHRARGLATTTSAPAATPAPAGAPAGTETAALLDETLARVREGGTAEGTNLVAYSGGVDSSLVAALLFRAYPGNSHACIGLSASLPATQLALAREVAAAIGIPLREVATAEGSSPGYVANAGMACFHCKTHLYAALEAVAAEAGAMRGPVTLFNGTNKEDRKDPTRVGLRAAADFRVRSPIDHLSKAQVRALARALGLPNWQHAASPCLRSRLALGVPALEDHLRRVEHAEGAVRRALGPALQVQHNLRVRLLAGGRGAVELDAELLPAAGSAMGEIERELRGLGFEGGVALRAFKSGSVSTTAGLGDGNEGAGGGDGKAGAGGGGGDGVVVVHSSR